MAQATKQSKHLLNEILSEVRRLRTEVSLFLPDEHIQEYDNVAQIKAAFTKALKKHPRK